MYEKPHKIEISDIRVPVIEFGGTAIVFQRHGKYNRNKDADNAGSITDQSAEEMYAYDKLFFDEILEQEDVYILFASSDTQYAGKGHRSMETAQIAQDAAVDAMSRAGVDSAERIININPAFKTARYEDTDQDIRPIVGLREPQIFNPRDTQYLAHLQTQYGYADEEAKIGLSPKAWAMHEMDTEKRARELTGAEGQEELIARTKKSLAMIERYAKIWHANNPGKRLLVWVASHYDTISPVVKEARGTLRNEDGTLSDAYQPVDYGGGVVIAISPEDGKERSLAFLDTSLPLHLGGGAVSSSVMALNQPKH
ncbi:MAG: hypothetical protein WBP22_05495 [Candidatus Saccharimonas sp.]